MHHLPEHYSELCNFDNNKKVCGLRFIHITLFNFTFKLITVQVLCVVITLL